MKIVEIVCVVCDTNERLQALVSQANNMPTLKHIIVTEDVPHSYKSKGNLNFFYIDCP